MKLAQALGIRPGDVVAFVGAGGKTTALFRLARELVEQGMRVVTTTTTRLARHEIDNISQHFEVEDTQNPPDRLSSLLEQHRHVFVFARLEDPDKVRGVSEAWLDAHLATLPPLDALLIEADGSRRLLLKAPYPHEPALPATATLVVMVAGLGALGQPLTADHVYGAELIQGRLGLPPGTPVTAEVIASVLADPAMGLKSIPPGARALALLNGVTPETLPQARAIARRLLAETRIERVLVGAVEEDDPVWETRQRVGAVILAAGRSERMGQPKLLLPWGEGTTIIRQVAEQVAACEDLRPIVAVTGQWQDAITRQVSGLPMATAHNPRYAEGEMLSSLQKGLEALQDSQCDACLVALGDQPGIERAVIDAVLAAYAQGRGRIVAPAFQGQRGHPVLIDRVFWQALLALPRGAAPRDVLRAYPHEVYELPVETPSILQDIDTPEDYHQTKPSG